MDAAPDESGHELSEPLSKSSTRVAVVGETDVEFGDTPLDSLISFDQSLSPQETVPSGPVRLFIVLNQVLSDGIL